MTFFVLASVIPPPPPYVEPPYDTRSLWLESWDGTRTIPVPLDDYPHPVVGQRGFLGLGVNPNELVEHATPGSAGTQVAGVTFPARPVALPLALLADTQAELWRIMQDLRDLTDPHTGMTMDGNFRLVVSSVSGTRQLPLAYRSGLEGEDTEYDGTDHVVLDCVAVQPYAEDREESAMTFRLATGSKPFLAAAGTTHPWGTRTLSPSTVLGGTGTSVDLHSAVPVWPTLEITGPVTSVTLTSNTGLSLSVPGGVAAGSTLRIVTSPRRKAIRLNGAPAAGLVARGSVLQPFTIGPNLLSVTAPGATDATSLRLVWRGMYRSLW